ncbi:MAG: class I SAM-dependent methyltransferase [Pseudomonadota bacterium]
MTMDAASVVAHYARDQLLDRIRIALIAAGHDPDRPTVEMLSELDHLHGGGLATTVAQVNLAGISRGCRVLDAGCGIGGPSRYLADKLDCQVEAIDLTPVYVDVARQLNEWVGLQDQIKVAVGDVTDLSCDDGRFDVVLSQNVSMNVANKQAMFKEAFRVLRPGGIYTFSHLAEGPAGSPIYPLPWARTPDVSFLGTPGEIVDLLSEAGFVNIVDRISEARSKPGGAPTPGTIGAVPAMGDDMPTRTGNSARSIEEGRLVPMMIVARRPS